MAKAKSTHKRSGSQIKTSKPSSGKWIQGATKPQNKGSFTKYCGGKVSMACIKKGEHSPDKKTRARARFADAMRSIHRK